MWCVVCVGVCVHACMCVYTVVIHLLLYARDFDAFNAHLKNVLLLHRVSDAFYGLMTMGSNMTTQRLQTGIKRAFDSLAKSADNSRPVTCELMTHPGYPCKGPGGCGDGPDDFSQSPDREHEKSILECEEMRNFYKANNITLMSYHECLADSKMGR